jgi:hypothetical protein
VLFHPVSLEECEIGPSAFTIERIQSLIGTRRVDIQRLRIFQAFSAFLLCLLIVASALAVFSYFQREQARAARDDALAALRTQSLLIHDASATLLDNGDAASASLLELEGLPDKASDREIRRIWPYIPEVEQLRTLRTITATNSLNAVA